MKASEKAAHIWQRDPLDWYVEPRRVTRQLLAVERFEGMIFDPACGEGNIVEECRAAGLDAHGADIENRFGPEADGWPKWWCGRQDFLKRGRLRPFENVVTNPPYGICESFIRHALGMGPRKLAAFVDIRFLPGAGRAKGFYRDHPPSRIWFVTPRPSCPPGEFLRNGGKAAGGSLDYCWLVWDRNAPGHTMAGWLVEGES